jgi:hypothetical protein
MSVISKPRNPHTFSAYTWQLFQYYRMSHLFSFLSRHRDFKHMYLPYVPVVRFLSGVLLIRQVSVKV